MGGKGGGVGVMISQTSGTVVILMQCAPHECHSLLSALDENRGPSIVRIVPLS